MTHKRPRIDLLKPYREKVSKHDRKHANKRLRSARRIIEMYYRICNVCFIQRLWSHQITLNPSRSCLRLTQLLREKCTSINYNDFLSNDEDDDDELNSSALEVFTQLKRRNNRHRGEKGKQVRVLFL
jgi:hypothetical protein